MGKKKVTDSKLETQIKSELLDYELRSLLLAFSTRRYANGEYYEFNIISCCNLLKVAHTSRVVAAGI